MRQIVSIANRLPITIGRKIKKSSGGLVSAMEGAKHSCALKWIGWPGGVVNDASRAKELERELREKYDCIPVYLSRRQIKNYYHGFSNSSLWPLLHYMSNYVRHNRIWWEEYKKVNEAFADIVEKEVSEDDFIWIQDYHLMLLPQMLRERRRNLRIGFFLHTPFPSYEIFRCHPHRTELLKGLLGADLIGFHTYGYMRHFRSSVVRLLGLESGMNVIPHDNRSCHMGVYPIGINSHAFKEELASERLQNKKNELREIYKGKQIVLSVERLDYTKGLLRRLDAIDRFLAKWPDKDKVVFIFVSVPSRGEVREYQQLRERIEGLVGRINGAHSTVGNTPIHFIHKSVPFTDLCALYSLADVAMVTPLIDGMNLVAKEYVACKKNAKGVLMLSEFAGAAEELFKAITVNPYDVDQMADRLRQALTVPEAEKIDRMEGIYERVMEYDAEYWANSFLKDLQKPMVHYGEDIKIRNVNTEIVGKFKKAKKPAFFLDYDGTLADIFDEPKKAKPTPTMHKLFECLQNHPKADIFILSGRKLDTLKEWLGQYPFTLIGEHGYRYRPAEEDEFQLLYEAADLSWKPKVIEILEYWTGNTPGSFIEEKICSVVWHYRRSDPEFGQWKAHQLVSSLYEILANLPVEVHHGKKIVEISSIQVNKGAAMEKFLRQNTYDQILCAGDDLTDENMFSIDDERLIRIKIGEGDTKADYRVKNPQQFRKLLLDILEVMPK